MEKSVVRVENLSHRYNVQWAIRDINFEIDQRGVVGLLGSNGAGKSTTMNIICGVLKQTSGEVYINGVNSLKDPIAARKNIGFLPQKPPLYPDLTVDEYLRFCAEMRLVDPKKINRAVEETEERCGISHFKGRLLRNLSGGYQQRVSIAQAIIHDPKFVVLDEPTNGLDPNQIMEIRHLIRDIAKDRTVILSTHILTEVQAVCDHILMIEEGKLVFMGTVDEFDNYIIPNSLYVSMIDPPVADELAKIEGVLGVEELGNRNFRIRFTEAQEVIDQIVKLSAANDWRLSEVRVEKSSLDNIFAELSKKAH